MRHCGCPFSQDAGPGQQCRPGPVAAAIIAARAAALAAEGVTARAVVRAGVPWREIVHLAAEEHADMIVMGTQGRTGLEHLLLGSVAERVVRTAPCPVLTVRPDIDNNE